MGNRSRTARGGGARGYSYDAYGNVTADGLRSFTYDRANQPVSVAAGATAAYTYDGNLKRVKSNFLPTGFTAGRRFGREIRGDTISGLYGARGRTWRRLVRGKTVYTVYSKLTGGLVHRDEVTDGKVTDYVSVGPAPEGLWAHHFPKFGLLK